MGENRTKRTFAVKGMTCSGCEMKVERILSRLEGVKSAKASFSGNCVTVEYDSVITGVPAMAAALAKAGYSLGAEGTKASRGERMDPQGKKRLRVDQLIGLVIVLLAGYFLIDKTIGFDFIPEVNASMGYGMLFVVGLLTSIHCVAMCGGLNLSQCIAPAAQTGGPAKLKSSLLYNAGRVISYTIIGGIVGALGHAVSFSGWARGIVAVLSGLFMVIMGISMLGIFPWINKIIPRMPRFLRSRAGEARQGRGPFVVGLLNGLMPCGPLQAMQLYALGTGSFFAGAMSMFLFSLGTVPLMFGLGALSSLLSSKFTSKMMTVSAALVLLLGFVMVNRGLALSGIRFMPIADIRTQTLDQNPQTAPNAVIAEDGVQYVTSKLSSGRYPPITVYAGTPVRWNLQAEASALNGCNRTLVIPQFDKQVQLKPGDNIIEFTPTQQGTIPYSCWMGMITGKITVVAAGDSATQTQAAAQSAPTSLDSVDSGFLGATGEGCCASAALAPSFADGNIPTDEVAVAKVEDGAQIVTITVNDQGYSPAVAVVQKGIKTKIRFVDEKLNTCNSYVVFPEYNGAIDLSSGQTETPELQPKDDFTFECGMGMLHGYVKVVDDINNFDMARIKAEVDQYVPAASAGGSCCQ